MTVQIDDQFPDHPKVIAVGGDAGWLLLCALCYCSKHGTDGRVPSSLIGRLSDRRRPGALWQRLHAQTLVHGPGDTCGSLDCPATYDPPPAETWVIHEYWRWNESSERAKRRRDATARRVRDHRARNGVTNGDGNGPETLPTTTTTTTTSEEPSLERSLTVVVGQLGDKLRMGNA